MGCLGRKLDGFVNEADRAYFQTRNRSIEHHVRRHQGPAMLSEGEWGVREEREVRGTGGDRRRREKAMSKRGGERGARE
eukprot:2075951-Rhodomonas_salina.1